jgi:hypothetical protein
MLLVVVNLAALGRRNFELVHMVPVPYFEDDGATGAYAIISVLSYWIMTIVWGK